MLVPVQRMLFSAVAVAAVLFGGVSFSRADNDPAQCVASESCPECRNIRKGCPQSIAWYAQPSNTPRYVGYYVGGGAAFGGEPRCANEGTWGWDFSGTLIERNVWLNWWHGSRYQGGTGSYRTDGPRLVQPHY
jgi:hypothetical protein